MSHPRPYDVLILGGGLAGLSLARQLLLQGGEELRVLLLDKRRELPAPHQKVGESCVQVSGYYFSKVLEMEEHLFNEHYLKYNLRFYWKTPGRGNDGYEDYSQAYIRPFSNVASYQLDRNRFEAELLARNRADPRFHLALGARDPRAEICEDGGLHTLRYRQGSGDGDGEITARGRWLVDATGRGRLLARRQDLAQPNAIRHGAAFLWVEGLLNVETLSGLSPRELRLHPSRRALGHLPVWLATNHFMGPGYWFWVIPLRGKTSLGLVYDRETFPAAEVATAEKLLAWVCRQFPLFARELPRRRVLHYAGLPEFSHDCRRTLHPHRLAFTGEAGRFSDPLYSPGGDLIAFHNTLLTDAILGEDGGDSEGKLRLYEQLLRAVYEAYVPSYALSYDTLGDQETFVLKYGWELAIYFGFYVFPFVNDLFTDRRFLLAFLNKFSRLGPLNRTLQQALSDFFRWKRGEGLTPPAEPAFFDFFQLRALKAAEETFYEVGVGVPAARRVLARQLENLEEMARWELAWMASRAVGDRRALTCHPFVAALDPATFTFDPGALRRLWAEHAGSAERWRWSFDPAVLAPLCGAGPANGEASAAPESLTAAVGGG